MEISSGLNYKKMSMILKRCNHSASLTKRKIRPLAIINCFSLTQKYRLKIESCRVISDHPSPTLFTLFLSRLGWRYNSFRSQCTISSNYFSFKRPPHLRRERISLPSQDIYSEQRRLDASYPIVNEHFGVHQFQLLWEAWHHFVTSAQD